MKSRLGTGVVNLKPRQPRPKSKADVAAPCGLSKVGVDALGGKPALEDMRLKV